MTRRSIGRFQCQLGAAQRREGAVLGGVLGEPHRAVEPVPIGERDPAQPQLPPVLDQLLGVRGPLEEAEVGPAVKLGLVGVGHRTAVIPEQAFDLRFPSPVTIDAAIPTSIDAPAQPVCLETLLPWVASKADAESFAADEDAFRAAVAGLPVQDAPPAVALPHECAVRNATAHVVTLQRSFVADGAGRTATVLVSLDIDDHVTDTRIILSSGASHIDKAALDAARRTRYATTVFNCTKLEADYVFTVSF